MHLVKNKPLKQQKTSLLLPNVINTDHQRYNLFVGKGKLASLLFILNEVVVFFMSYALPYL